jgi:hypothetical protein
MTSTDRRMPVVGATLTALLLIGTAGSAYAAGQLPDGSSPTAGIAYTAPLTVGSGSTTLKAIAGADCMLDSDITQGSFQIGSGTPVTTVLDAGRVVRIAGL